MTPFDYGVLAFYFAFMVAISWIFRRFVGNVSDYFRGGGKALWWMAGGSAFMVQFSAWTFTGAASMAYMVGWPILAIYVGNILGFLVNAFFFAPRIRQLRVITGMEAVRLRYGAASEQVFTWLQIPIGLLHAAIWLNALAVFAAAVFGLNVPFTILVTGVVVMLVALLGGSWAVLASDFVQVLILMPVCLAVTVMALIKIGGVHVFSSAMPSGHVPLDQLFSNKLLLVWCVAMLLKQLHTTNNLGDAHRYLCVKDGRHARRAGLLGAGLFSVGIVIWFVPPIAAAIRFPDLHALFPSLPNPSEGAYIAMARDVMPVGMMGLLVSGIFAATMSSMDAGLNRNSGFFVRNFYQPVLRPNATDRDLLRAGKATTVVLGGLIILIALRMSELRGFSLFIWMQRVGILIGIPVLVPLVLGVIVRNTPPWSGWSTVAVGFVSSLLITSRLTPNWGTLFPHLGAVPELMRAEYSRESAEMIGNFVVCSLWFLGTKLFWSRVSAEHRARVNTFFQRMHTPVDFAREEGAAAANDARQQLVIGWICITYGAFVTALMLIPNPLAGRIAFLGCAAVALVTGFALVLCATRSQRVRG